MLRDRVALAHHVMSGLTHAAQSDRFAEKMRSIANAASSMFLTTARHMNRGGDVGPNT